MLQFSRYRQELRSLPSICLNLLELSSTSMDSSSLYLAILKKYSELGQCSASVWTGSDVILEAVVSNLLLCNVCILISTFSLVMVIVVPAAAALVLLVLFAVLANSVFLVHSRLFFGPCCSFLWQATSVHLGWLHIIFAQPFNYAFQIVALFFYFV